MKTLIRSLLISLEIMIIVGCATAKDVIHNVEIAGEMANVLFTKGAPKLEQKLLNEQDQIAAQYGRLSLQFGQNQSFLSFLYITLGRPDLGKPHLIAAIKAFEHAAQSQNAFDRRWANRELSRSYIDMTYYLVEDGEYQKAESILKQFVDDKDLRRAAYSKLKHVYDEQGRYLEALEIQQNLAKTLPFEEDPRDSTLGKFMIWSFGLSDSFELSDIADQVILGFSLASIGRNKEALNILEPVVHSLGDGDSLDHFEKTNLGLVASLMSSISEFYFEQGRYDAAEKLTWRVNKRVEESLPDTFVHGGVLMQMGNFYSRMHRFDESKRFFEKGYKLLENYRGINSPVSIGMKYSFDKLNLYDVHNDTYNYNDMYNRTKDVLRKISGKLAETNRVIISTKIDLARASVEIGKYGEADVLINDLLAAVTRTQGQRSQNTMELYRLKASLLEKQGAFQGAATLLRQQLDIATEILGRNHPVTISIGAKLAKLEARLGQKTDALKRVARILEVAKSRQSVTMPNEMSPVVDMLEVSYTLYSTDRQNNTALNLGFEVDQFGKFNRTAEAVRQMTARLAAQPGQSSEAIRKVQDTETRIRQIDDAVRNLSAHADTPSYRSEIDKLLQEREGLERKLESALTELKRVDPEFVRLSKPDSVSLQKVQQILRPEEVLLTYNVLKDAVYIFAVRRNEVKWYRQAVGYETLDKLVKDVRKSLDTPQPDFDLDAAGQLYDVLIRPVTPLIEGQTRIFIVANGSLESLPFAALAPGLVGKGKSLTGMGDIPWLGWNYELAILPAISSLEGLRSLAPRSIAPQPFLGIGDPLVPKREKTIDSFKCGVATEGLARRQRGSIDGNVTNWSSPHGIYREVAKDIGELPETSCELEVIARTLGADPERNLLVREAATKPKITKVNFQDYRIVAFATHAYMSNELRINEPALLLTPPLEVQPDDDGLLSVTDVMPLKFNADLVLLSACNTAASDGRPEAEGLSGLARAFFYAGARNLAVSQWYIASAQTVELTTTWLTRWKEKPQATLSGALKESMQLLGKNGKGFDHPKYWAPFIVVGDGTVTYR